MLKRVHHFHLSINVGKPYVTIWRLQVVKDTQFTSKDGQRRVIRLAFGVFRCEFSLYTV